MGRIVEWADLLEKQLKNKMEKKLEKKLGDKLTNYGMMSNPTWSSFRPDPWVDHHFFTLSFKNAIQRDLCSSILFRGLWSSLHFYTCQLLPVRPTLKVTNSLAGRIISLKVTTFIVSLRHSCKKAKNVVILAPKMCDLQHFQICDMRTYLWNNSFWKIIFIITILYLETAGKLHWTIGPSEMRHNSKFEVGFQSKIQLWSI